MLFLAATTTIGLPAVDAASSADSSASKCTAVTAACFENEFCASCLSEYDQASYEECLTVSLNALDVSSASAGCEFQSSIVPCCNDHASEHACMISDEYVAYWQCFMQDGGCPISDISCTGFDSSPDGSNSGAVARAGKPAAVAFACVLGPAVALLLSLML